MEKKVQGDLFNEFTNLLLSNICEAIDIFEIDFVDDEPRLGSLIYRNHRCKEYIKSCGDIFSDEMLTLKSKCATPTRVEHHCDDGQRHFDWSSFTFDQNDKVYYIRSIKDITDQLPKEPVSKEQFVALNEKNNKLEKYIEYNLQLENFAYIASHDLKAPLRTVLSFSQLIKRDSYDLLSEKSKNFIDIVINSSNHMMLVIEDLLSYSLANTSELNITSFEVKGLWRALLYKFENDIEKTGAEIEGHFGNEIIVADRDKMDTIIGHLISNALKFVTVDRKPHISLHLYDRAEYYEFKLTDNGIGIDQKNVDKIFQVFSKLHSNDKYPGSGLGLNICQKLISKHQGKLWVESEENKGSSFFFTISKNLS